MGSHIMARNVPETVPFPDGYPIIELPQISLRKLLESDEDEIDKIWGICRSTGFFYLNLVDHPQGLKLWNDGVDACEVGQAILSKLPMEEKLAYKARDRLGVFDMGYKCPSVGPNGEPKFSEAFNVPLYEMAIDPASGFQLPSWLAPHRELFISLLQNGNNISDILLSVLERQLQVSKGDLMKFHRFTDPSNDFLRVLRYPGTPEGTQISQTNFPPHRDSVSIAMLFTWVGGLQILDPAFESKLQGEGANGSGSLEGWRWVKPIPGHVIVNLGDALSILTNGVLKSGFHRVITAPGAQQPLDKYSVLLGYRPALVTKMTPLVSSVIPPLTPKQQKDQVLTCEEWGAQRVHKVYTVLENR
ncbi:oxidoreductase [Penicillium vulpinum]|uniref:Fe2OG dioxygenase domain-containing protein n=1 Tax=Penicillium vulpinum TaxID=29845 RepID=A0A1V6R3B8_9EURO|nr:oxidoreductase [Penicillium vulpinum]KAJ5957960.1 oxidoreductase [Penicillium vulpinum]OQD95988.1 hypothetical protein PENVUL_c099G09370 [Penicillium vulpinum]